MVKNINVYGAPVLHQKCVPCEPYVPKSFLSEVSEKQGEYWTKEIIELVQDLKDTALADAFNTLGLAAPQIWDKDAPCPAVFVVRTNAGTPEIPEWAFSELINPHIRTTGKTLKIKEGCLSVPNYTRTVNREANVMVEYQLLTGAEIYKTKLFSKNDANAIVIQHEYDHLQGKLIKR
jgi:peptide deformylase